jgi:hypothetical protein
MKNKFFKGLLVSSIAASALFGLDVSYTKAVDTNTFYWGQEVSTQGEIIVKFPIRIPLNHPDLAGETISIKNMFGGVMVDGNHAKLTVKVLDNEVISATTVDGTEITMTEEQKKAFFVVDNGVLQLKGNHAYAVQSTNSDLNLKLFVETPAVVVDPTEPVTCIPTVEAKLTVVDDKGIPQVPGPASDATVSVDGDNVTITFIEDVLLAQSGTAADATSNMITADGANVTVSKDQTFVKIVGAAGTTAIYEISMEETACPDETPVEEPVVECTEDKIAEAVADAIATQGLITVEECPATEIPPEYIKEDDCPVTPIPEEYIDGTDDDADGVPNVNDTCADTPANSFVNATGCSQAQLEPEEPSEPTEPTEPTEPVDSYSEYDTVAVDGAGSAIADADLSGYSVNVFTLAEDDLSGQNGKVAPIKAMIDGESVNIFVNEGYVGKDVVVKLMENGSVVGATKTTLETGMNEVELSISPVESTEPVSGDLEDNLDYATPAVDGAGSALADGTVGTYSVNAFSMEADDLSGQNGKVVPLKVVIGDESGMIFVNEGYIGKSLVVKVYENGALVNLSSETEIVSGLNEINID